MPTTKAADNARKGGEHEHFRPSSSEREILTDRRRCRQRITGSSRAARARGHPCRRDRHRTTRVVDRRRRRASGGCAADRCAADRCAVEPRAQRCHRALRTAIAVREERRADAEQPEGAARGSGRPHTAPSDERLDHPERAAFRRVLGRGSGHRSGQASACDPWPRQAAAGFYPRRARQVSDDDAGDLSRMRRQQRAAVLARAAASKSAGAARVGLLRRMDRCEALHPARRSRHRHEGEVVHRRRSRCACCCRATKAT